MRVTLCDDRPIWGTVTLKLQCRIFNVIKDLTVQPNLWVTSSKMEILPSKTLVYTRVLTMQWKE